MRRGRKSAREAFEAARRLLCDTAEDVVAGRCELRWLVTAVQDYDRTRHALLSSKATPTTFARPAARPTPAPTPGDAQEWR